jgi:hypothetical protein
VDWLQSDPAALRGNLEMVLVGAALLLFAFLWRRRARRRAIQAVREHLASPDPEVRSFIIREATAHGLDPYADELLDHARTEADERVLRTLMQAVAFHQWEPADKASVRGLRQMAQDYYQERAPTERTVEEDSVIAFPGRFYGDVDSKQD